MTNKTPVVIVTGMAGSGRGTALDNLADRGFDAVDNLPLPHLEAVIRSGTGTPLAVGIDSRTRKFSVPEFRQKLTTLREIESIDLNLLFLDCDNEVLARRFTETRRRHPMAPGANFVDGILTERRMIRPLRDDADHIIDTSHLSPRDLAEQLGSIFGERAEKSPLVSIVSFSYKRGLPREADLVFDMRYLQNPHYVEDLRALTGTTKAVQDYVKADATYDESVRHISSLMVALLPSYEREGKTYLTIGIGCTGGKHRSVTVAIDLAERIGLAGWPVVLRHRDMPV